MCSILEFRENFRNLALLTINKVDMIMSILQRPEKATQFCQGHMKEPMAEPILLYYSIVPDVCLSWIFSFSTYQNITCFSNQTPIHILVYTCPFGELVGLGKFHVFQFYVRARTMYKKRLSYLFFEITDTLCSIEPYFVSNNFR